MAKEKVEDTAEDDILSAFESDAGDGGEATPELDDAIGDLRGVLQSDADGTLPDIGEASEGVDLSDFESDIGADFGGSDFGSDLGGSDFGSDLGGDFGDDLGAGFGGGSGMDAAPLGSALHSNVDLIMDIPIDVQIVLGKSHMNVATLMNLNEGATIALDRKIGEPVEILVNGRLIGRGEITVLDEDNTRFGVKLIEIMKVEKKA